MPKLKLRLSQIKFLSSTAAAFTNGSMSQFPIAHQKLSPPIKYNIYNIHKHECQVSNFYEWKMKASLQLTPRLYMFVDNARDKGIKLFIFFSDIAPNCFYSHGRLGGKPLVKLVLRPKRMNWQTDMFYPTEALKNHFVGNKICWPSTEN